MKNENKGNGNGKGKGQGKGQSPFEDCIPSSPGNSGKGSKGNTAKGDQKPGNGFGPFHNPGKGNKYGLYKKYGDGENGEVLKSQMDVSKTTYLYEGLSTNLLKEYSDAGSPYAEYYLGPNNQVVSRKMFGLHGLANPAYDPNLKTTGGMLYYQYDGLHTVSAVTDRHGDIIENYRYDVFGGIQTGITAPYNHNGYTGQRYDAKSSFIDMNARWYDPSVGRFLTPDTYRGELTNPLTQNRYAYVLNNPVNMWDPTGHVPEWVENREYHLDEHREQGYAEMWIFKDYETNSHTKMVDKDVGLKFIKKTYRNTTKEYWRYNYLYLKFIEEDLAYKTITEKIKTFKRTTVSEWTETITAREIAEQNQKEIANLTPPPNAIEVSNESSLIDGNVPGYFSDDSKQNTLTETEQIIRRSLNNQLNGNYNHFEILNLEMDKEEIQLKNRTINNQLNGNYYDNIEKLRYVNEQIKFNFKDSEFSGSAWRGTRTKVVGEIEINLNIDGFVKEISKSPLGNQVEITLPNGQKIGVDKKNNSLSYSFPSIKEEISNVKDIIMDLEFTPAKIEIMEEGYVQVAEAKLSTNKKLDDGIKISINGNVKLGLKKEDYQRQIESQAFIVQTTPLKSDADYPVVKLNTGKFGEFKYPAWDIPEFNSDSTIINNGILEKNNSPSKIPKYNFELKQKLRYKVPIRVPIF
ncbi:MAG: RHS repeat-associated core domain-containing protein [Bacillaceae bacterium]|nr:RHS repeat-associated core domain-containing protein [Bacillaceae bacterium]